MKRSVVIGLVAVCLLAGCAKIETTPAVDEKLKNEILSSIQVLRDNDHYLISSMDELASDTVYFVNVKDVDEFYIEYPVDKDTNQIGTLDYGTSLEMSYLLQTLVQADGTVYNFNRDTAYKMPVGYADYIKSMDCMFVDKMVETATEIKESDTIKLTIDGTDWDMRGYELTIPSETVRQVFLCEPEGEYRTLIEQQGADSNVGKLCQYYLDQLDRSAQFSDGKVYIGIDINGCLRYMCMNTGGLGEYRFLTQVVENFDASSAVDNVDLSAPVDCVLLYSDLAEFVSQYDTVEDAIDAYNKLSLAVSEGETEEETSEAVEESSSESAEELSSESAEELTSEESQSVEETLDVEETTIESSESTKEE